jgi:hypothetical protein
VGRFPNSNYLKPSFVLPVSDDDNVARAGNTVLDLDKEASPAYVYYDCRFQEWAPLTHSAKAALSVKLNARL